jgi:hypothetical protein
MLANLNLRNFEINKLNVNEFTVRILLTKKIWTNFLKTYDAVQEDPQPPIVQFESFLIKSIRKTLKKKIEEDSEKWAKITLRIAQAEEDENYD